MLLTDQDRRWVRTALPDPSVPRSLRLGWLHGTRPGWTGKVESRSSVT
jgi:hypothetical protein